MPIRPLHKRYKHTGCNTLNEIAPYLESSSILSNTVIVWSISQQQHQAWMVGITLLGCSLYVSCWVLFLLHYMTNVQGRWLYLSSGGSRPPSNEVCIYTHESDNGRSPVINERSQLSWSTEFRMNTHMYWPLSFSFSCCSELSKVKVSLIYINVPEIFHSLSWIKLCIASWSFKILRLPSHGNSHILASSVGIIGSTKHTQLLKYSFNTKCFFKFTHTFLYFSRIYITW